MYLEALSNWNRNLPSFSENEAIGINPGKPHGGQQTSCSWTQSRDLTLAIRGSASKGDQSLWVGLKLVVEEAEAREGILKALGGGRDYSKLFPPLPVSVSLSVK